MRGQSLVLPDDLQSLLSCRGALRSAGARCPPLPWRCSAGATRWPPAPSRGAAQAQRTRASSTPRFGAEVGGGGRLPAGRRKRAAERARQDGGAAVPGPPQGACRCAGRHRAQAGGSRPAPSRSTRSRWRRSSPKRTCCALPPAWKRRHRRSTGRRAAVRRPGAGPSGGQHPATGDALGGAAPGAGEAPWCPRPSCHEGRPRRRGASAACWPASRPRRRGGRGP